MTIIRETSIARFTALAADVKPVDVPAGSYLWESDTNILYKTQDGTNWTATNIKSTLKSTTINLQQAADDYDLFTGTAQDVLITKLVFALPAVNVADDSAITSISIQTNNSTPQTFISSTSGAKANLTASAQLAWTGAIILAATKKIQLTINGGTADASTLCKVTVEYIPITAGGYLS